LLFRIAGTVNYSKRYSPFDAVAKYLKAWYLVGSEIVLMLLGGVFREKSGEFGNGWDLCCRGNLMW